MKKKILIVLGSGGHTTQILKLLSLLNNRYDYEYVVNDNDLVSLKKVKGKFYKISNPRVFEDSIFLKAYKFVKSFFEAYSIIKKSKPYAVISSGPGLTIPLFIIAKMFKIKTIFIESWCRCYTKSVSGRICYYFSDLFFVQWPTLKNHYPKAIYAGRLG